MVVLFGAVWCHLGFCVSTKKDSLSVQTGQQPVLFRILFCEVERNTVRLMTENSSTNRLKSS